MLDFDSAQQRLAAAGTAPQQTETCALRDAARRVLARDFLAAIDLPPADNSAMDGYALRHADYRPDSPLPVSQRCFAGQMPQALALGTTARVFTGSLIPEGADTVVMQEDCEERDGQLHIRQTPRAKAHIRYRGEDMAVGRTLLSAGAMLGPAEIAVLASQGCAEVPVYRRLRVGILTTGDELAAPGTPLSQSQIYNSNAPMLASLVEGMGAQAARIDHALDTPQSLDAALRAQWQDCDLILSVGGVSVGEKDLVKPALEALGGKLDLWRVNIKPGKPVALAHLGKTPVVCLPGNPVSAFAVFTLLVSPLLRAMQGRTTLFPPVGTGAPDRDIVNKGDRIEFMRVQASHGVHPDGHPVQWLAPYGQQSSGVLSSLPWASGLARIPAATTVGQGSAVAYYALRDWLA